MSVNVFFYLVPFRAQLTQKNKKMGKPRAQLTKNNKNMGKPRAHTTPMSKQDGGTYCQGPGSPMGLLETSLLPPEVDGEVGGGGGG